METRKTTQYLVVGCAHLGMDLQICELFASAAQAFAHTIKNGKFGGTYHLGPLLTRQELQTYEQAIGKSRIYETQIDEVIKSRGMTDKEAAEWDKYIDKLAASLDFFTTTQDARVQQLINYFGENITLIANKEGYISTPLAAKYLDVCHTTKICKWLSFASTMANGERVAHAPITDQTFAAVRSAKTSMILPHPTPQCRPFNKPGKNNAHHYWATGGLKLQSKSNRPSERFKAVNRPRSLIVSVDDASGEFYITPLRVDFVDGSLAVLVDGLVITPESVSEALDGDRATLTADEHAPYACPAVSAALVATAELHGRELHIHAGDCGEFPSMNPHTKTKPKMKENTRLGADLRAVRAVFDKQGKFKNRVWVLGNHDKWLNRYLDEHPELIGVADWVTLLPKFFSGIKLRVVGMQEEDQEIYSWGDTVIRHGHTESLDTAIRLFGKVLLGHFHYQEEFLDGMKLGTAGDTFRDFHGDRILSHLNQFATGTKFKNVSRFTAKLVLTHDKTARFCYRGQIYSTEIV